jgi:hypothetical protein
MRIASDAREWPFLALPREQATDRMRNMRAGGWKSVEVLGRYLEAAEHNVWE